MGVSLTNCYHNNDDVKQLDPEDKKLILRSNPRSIAEKIKMRKNLYGDNNSDCSPETRNDKIPFPNQESNEEKENTKAVTESSESVNHKYGSISNRIIENYVQNNSSICSDKKKLKNVFIKEDGNYFLSFENSHRQISFLGKSFRSVNDRNLNQKLDEFLERESVFNKGTFRDIEFSIEAIVEKYSTYKEENSNSLSMSNNLSISDLIKYNTENNSGHSNKKNGSQASNPSVEISTGTNSFKFFVISNIFIYDFEYHFTNKSLVLRRKINVLSIDFFSITPDLKKLIIHVNSILDGGGNLFINNENSIHICFCICSILFYCYSTAKNLVVIPKSQFFYEKIKKLSSYEKMKDHFNKYALDVYVKIGELIPYDRDEVLVKLIPLSKIETKFTDNKVVKLILLTNKKILEISSENIEISKINIIPLCKMKKINEFFKSHKFQIIMEDNNNIQYSTIHTKTLIRMIKTEHSKECLLELEVNRMD